MTIKFEENSFQMTMQESGTAIAAESGMVRFDGTDSPGLRITRPDGVSFEINEGIATLVLSFETRIEDLEGDVVLLQGDIAYLSGRPVTYLDLKSTEATRSIVSNELTTNQTYMIIDNSSSSNLTINTITSDGVADGRILIISLLYDYNPGVRGRVSINAITSLGLASPFLLTKKSEFLKLIRKDGAWVQFSPFDLRLSGPLYQDAEFSNLTADQYKISQELVLARGVLRTDPVTSDTFIDALPSYENSHWMVAKAAGNSIVGIGVTPTVVGTVSVMQPDNSVGSALQSPMVQILSAAAISAAASVTMPNLVTDAIYKPQFSATIETRAASQLTSMRAWVGLFANTPTNAAAQTGKHIGFRFDPVTALDTKWAFVYHDGTTLTVPTIPVLPDLAQYQLWRFRLYIDNTNLAAWINDTLVFAGQWTIPLSIPSAFIPAVSVITTTATARQIGFGQMSIVQKG